MEGVSGAAAARPEGPGGAAGRTPLNPVTLFRGSTHVNSQNQTPAAAGLTGFPAESGPPPPAPPPAARPGACAALGAGPGEGAEAAQPYRLHFAGAVAAS